MNDFDIAIVGAGAAGLSLAHHLLHSPLRDRSILIIEQNARPAGNRTWCFWAAGPTPFDSLVWRSWRQLRFTGNGGSQRLALGNYRYHMIRGLDFHTHMRRVLAAHPNVTWLAGQAASISSDDEHAQILVGEKRLTAHWAFDSRYDWAEWRSVAAPYHALRQHFTGWVIETAQAAFDPQAVTFLDFRTPQHGDMRFFYVLPFSPRQALVEYVLLGADRPEAALRDYIERVLGLRDYRVLTQEGGVSPLTDRAGARRAGPRVMNIGARGGMIKPTTGYAFTRIQRDSAAIVRSLLEHGHPFAVPATRPFFRLCDELMLHVMARPDVDLAAIFAALFRNNPPERVFRFLDEAASAGEILALMASLPPGPFLQAWAERKLLGRWQARFTPHGGPA